METKNENRKRWIVLLLCCMVACGNMGVSNAHGVFITPVTEKLGVSQTTFSLLTTVTTLVMSSLSLLIPRLFRKTGARGVLILGSVLGVSAYFLASRMKGVPSLALFLALKRAAYHLLGNATLLTIVNSWFDKEAGVASSIVTGCYGLAGAALSPLFAWGIESRSWRFGYLLAFGVSLIMFLPPLLSPVQYSRNTVRESSAEAKTGTGKDIFPYDPRGKAVLLVYATGIVSFMNIAFAEFLSSIAITKGMQLSEGALFSSAVMVGNIVSKLVNGWLSDRFGATRTAAAMLSVCAVSAIAILLSKNYIVLLIATFFFGALYSVSGLSLSLVNRELFGTEHFTKALTRTTFISSTVYAVLYPLWGVAYDYTGGYTIAMIVTIAVTVLLIPLLLRLDRRRRGMGETAG